MRACVVGAEDTAGDSFLNLARDGVAETVRACWASGFNAESLLYRHARGMDLVDVAVAVGVQEMAFGERSFVLFTRDPRTGDRQTAIAAGWGIGEGVVQEKVAVDHFFARTGADGETGAPAGPSGTRRRGDPPSRRGRPAC